MPNFPAYFINLDSREDKRVSIQSELMNAGFRSTRVPGQRPKSDSELLFFVTEEVAGCWLGHILAYNKMIENCNSFALIVEDDAIIPKNFAAKLSQIVENLSDLGIDAIQIGFVDVSRWSHFTRILLDNLWKIEVMSLSLVANLKLPFLDKLLSSRVRVKRSLLTQKVTQGVGLGWLRPDDFKPGTHAYVVSKEFAKILKLSNNPIFFSADQLLISLSKMCTFSMWRCTINYSKQNYRFNSDIEGKRFRKYLT